MNKDADDNLMMPPFDHQEYPSPSRFRKNDQGGEIYHHHHHHSQQVAFDKIIDDSSSKGPNMNSLIYSNSIYSRPQTTDPSAQPDLESERANSQKLKDKTRKHHKELIKARKLRMVQERQPTKVTVNDYIANVDSITINTSQDAYLEHPYVKPYLN